MTRIQIPENAGKDFQIVVARAGNYAITNNKTGKNKVFIPCRDKAHAEEILEKLKKADHEGEIWT
jgi:hypothetical protein